MAWLKLAREMLKTQFYCPHVESYSKSKACEYTWQSGKSRTILSAKVGEWCPQMNLVCILSTAYNSTESSL